MKSIEIVANTTMFGKRDKAHPFKAILAGDVIAYGTSKSDAQANAEREIEQAYIAAQAPLVVRVAKDGTVFIARWTGAERMEYWIQHPDLSGSACMGSCRQSLQSYMDKVVADYNACTAVEPAA